MGFPNLGRAQRSSSANVDSPCFGNGFVPPPHLNGKRIFPRITVVTPSYNHGKFLEQCICSVLNQRYPNLEYIIVDGGSSDNSVQIIEKYASHITYWVSEPDEGQYDAINKGFEHATGEILAWLNADDVYVPGSLHTVADIFAVFPEIEWATSVFPLVLHSNGIECSYRTGYNRRGFLRGENLPGAGWTAKGFIPQESTFWRRSLWKRAGGYVDKSWLFAGDFELWARFYQFADLYGIETILGVFRNHGDQKTAHYLDDYIEEARYILKKYHGRPYGRFHYRLRTKLMSLLPGSFKQVLCRTGLSSVSLKVVYRNCAWSIHRLCA